MSGGKPSISIVIPCYNEQEAFPHLRKALQDLSDQLDSQYQVEFILIDDGSRDDTWRMIRLFASEDTHVRGVALSRNFGHQMALTAGYDVAEGEAIISMDADLQDPPEAVIDMLQKWNEGADVVYGVRSNRESDTAFKRLTARAFYSLIRAMGAKHIRAESADFRLMSRRSLKALQRLREQHRFIRGMVGWIGYKEAEVHYQRRARSAGVSKYPFRKMLRFAMDAIISFSPTPLRFAYWLSSILVGLLAMFIVFSLVAWLFLRWTLLPGWTSLIVSVLALGAMNLFCIGLLGEYIGRIYEQSKNRPLYLIMEDTHAASAELAIPELTAARAR